MSTPLHRLQDLGQSVWYDNIHRALLNSGRLREYVDRYAVTGLTSNPSIFEQAIAGSSDYDETLRLAVQRGVDDPEELFWELAICDIQDAADVLRDTYEASGGTDGFVSLELPPRLSHDTEGSVQLGTELFTRLDRPNVMIKVPGTPEGVVAIEDLISFGVNVNVTLLFSLDQWHAVSEAYLHGLERRFEAGDDLDVVSVASYFISRIDAKANDRLPPDLRNRLGVASAQLALAAHRELIASDRWRGLSLSGARPQRLLWASTSTKDPSLPDTFYVSALAAAGTVNTMPEATMLAFARSGEVTTTMPTDGVQAEDLVRRAAEEGADLKALGEELQAEGDTAFADAFDRLLACIRSKTEALRSADEGRKARL
jgi:transaldolase